MNNADFDLAQEDNMEHFIEANPRVAALLIVLIVELTGAFIFYAHDIAAWLA